MGYKIVECKSLQNTHKSIYRDSVLQNLTQEEIKSLVDSLIDPVFVITNANQILKDKLEIFVDDKTRENFYMIDRAQKKLLDTINALRSTSKC